MNNIYKFLNLVCPPESDVHSTALLPPPAAGGVNGVGVNGPNLHLLLRTLYPRNATFYYALAYSVRSRHAFSNTAAFA